MSSQLSFFPDAHRAQLSWSVSRDKRLKTCLRRYYYQHFASKGGASAEASDEQRELYMLKWLRNRFMWVGEIVHEAVEHALDTMRSREQVDVDALCRRSVQRMRLQYSESLHRVYKERPRLACGLFEHEYQQSITRTQWREQRDRMERCIRNFFKLSLFEEICSTPSYRWLALEETSSFIVDDATVVVKPDFAWRDTDGLVHLVDWKTGIARPEDEKLQLAVYAILGQREWGARPEEIVGHVAYLEPGHVVRIDLNVHDLEWAENAIRESLATMRDVHRTETATDRFAMERFPMTQDLERCTMCNFKRHCAR
ncbi:MAG: PD-(D/E)XK nuclease family protein [Myxococcota bacterium]